MLTTQKRNSRSGCRTLRDVQQGPKIRLGRNGKAIHKANGKIIDNDDVVEGIVLLRKGAEGDAMLEGFMRRSRS